MNTQTSRTTESGVTLLIAFLAMTMSFSIATGIFTILYSEFKLAAQESDSIQAFYAANTGLECARYWDNARTNPSNGTTNYRAFNVAGVGSRIIRCNFGDNGNGNITVTQAGPNNNNRILRFIMNTSAGCADVQVNKDTNGQTRNTKILSRGRIRAGTNCTATSRTVERALEFEYTERLPNNP